MENLPPTIIIIDVARGVAVKCFIYNEKSCEMGFRKGAYPAGIQAAARLASEEMVFGGNTGAACILTSGDQLA